MPADSDSGSSQREHQRSDPMAEHKRRARWRLLGALIITGAVAAVAPVFLEEQARPLSQDLLIDIPSKNSAFTKIDSLKPAATEEPAPAAASAPTAPVAPVATPPKAETKAEAKSDTKAEQKTDTKTDAKTNGKAAAAKGFLVQVGAYAKLESANAVKTKLTAGGHRVVMETIKAEDGTDRYRVRIGPFETREQALSVRDRAKGQGYDAVVVNP